MEFLVEFKKRNGRTRKSDNHGCANTRHLTRILIMIDELGGKVGFNKLRAYTMLNTTRLADGLR